MMLRSRVWDKKQKKMIYDFFIDCDGIVFKRQSDYYAFKPEDIEVMYAPGLKDKNGKEIYGGDILRYPKGIFSVDNYTIGVVFFRDGCFICSCSRYSDKIEFLTDTEIIGNMFENPDIIGDMVLEKKEVR